MPLSSPSAILPPSEKKETAPYPTLIGSLLPRAAAAGVEIGAFYPFDTTTKRLMANKAVLQPGSSLVDYYGSVILKDAWGKNFLHWPASLYPGIASGLLYKIPQRIHKFGGSDYLRPIIHSKIDKVAGNTLDDKQTNVLAAGVTGVLVGASEVWMLPLDALKIGRQTNTMKGSIWSIVQSEKGKLWRGAAPTALRNATGSSALFGTDIAAKEYLLSVPGAKKPTIKEEVLASFAAITASLTAANPFDVVKTRVQAALGAVTPWKELKSLVATEGVSALFKGLPMKMVTVAPRQVFAFTVAKTLFSSNMTPGFFAPDETKKTPSLEGTDAKVDKPPELEREEVSERPPTP